jgi:amino acid adenylation domain-containing protein
MEHKDTIARKLAEKYWLRTLSRPGAGDLFLTPPPLPENRKNRVRMDFPPEIARKIKERFTGKNSEASKFLFFLAVLKLLYGHYCQCEDIIVATPDVTFPGLRPAFDRLLFLRSAMDPELRFREVMAREQKVLLEAFKHHDFDYSQLISRFRHNNLGDVRDLTRLGFYYNGLNSAPDPLENVALSLEILERGEAEDAVTAVLHHSAALDQRIYSDFLENFFFLADLCIGDADAKVGELAMVAPAQQENLLKLGAPEQVPIQDTVVDKFRRTAEKEPHRVALEMGFEALTYGELDRQSNRWAALLKTRGVAADVTVAVLMERSLDMIVAALAALKAGGVYLAVDASYPEYRVISILRDSNAYVVLVNNRALDRFSFTTLQDWGTVHVTPHKTAERPLGDFEQLPHPDRGLVDYEGYGNFIGLAMVKNAIAMQATRGCPFKCEYCHRVWPRNHSMRSAENIFEEVLFYYKLGVRQFAFIDDIFNFEIKNSTRFFQLVLKHKLDIQLFFTNGVRGDILTEDYIDLMFEAGTVNIGVALETASPRLQKLLGKNLNLDRFRRNVEYICAHYPNVILDLTSMHGLPTETEEEALMTLDFIKSLKWVHFPYAFVLKIHPNTGIGRIALEKGIPSEAIMKSMNFAYHDIPETLPFPKRFAQEYKARFMNEYFLLKERLLHVLPYQMKIATQDELVQKYNNYLPIEIRKFSDILHYAGISQEEFGEVEFLAEDHRFVADLNQKIAAAAPRTPPKPQALKVLFMDLSDLFSGERQDILHGEIVEPLGLMYLATHLKKEFAGAVDVKVIKARVDFDDYEALKRIIEDFNPNLVGIRSLSYYKDFFHHTVSLIREWGIKAPIISGGPYATLDFPMMLQDPDISLAVLGEGEYTLEELVRAILDNDGQWPADEALEHIAGIAFVPRESRHILDQRRRLIYSYEETAPSAALMPDAAEPTAISPDNAAFLIYTSGSTGKPKGILQTHRCLANVVTRQAFYGGFQPGLRVMQFSSVGFDVFIAHELGFSLASGGTLVVLGDELRKNLVLLGEFMVRRGIQWAFLPASVLKTIIELSAELRASGAALRHLVSAGEQLNLNRQLMDYLKANAHIKLHNFYGPSETHNATNHTLDPARDAIEVEQPIGSPAVNVWIYLLSPSMAPVPKGVAAEVFIGGAGLARGYLNDPGLTHERFIPNPFRPGETMYKTGDRARWLGDGGLQFLGRRDNQVKIRAQRIEPGEIVKRLLKFKGIDEAVVTVREAPDGEHYLAAYLKSAVKWNPQEAREYLAYYFPDYMIPAFFVPIDTIPLTPNGKVDKQALPDPYRPQSQSRTAPVNELEETLLKIWADVLGLQEEAVGTDSNFFELGGHSLKATVLISRIYRLLGSKITLGEVFKDPTIQGIARFLKETGAGQFISIAPAEQRDFYPLSSSQKRMFIVHQLDPQNLGYNMPSVMLLQGSLDVKRLERAFGGVIQRQEGLRTAFLTIDGQPAQQILKEVPFGVEYLDLQEVAAAYNPQEEKALVEELVTSFVKSFQLDRPPLMRLQAVKLRQDRHLLLADIHHIAGDGVSVSVIIREFTALYNGDTLPPLKLHYKDFAMWQHSRRHGQEIRKQEKFWLDQLDAAVPQLAFPTDFPRPEKMSFAGKHIVFELPAGITKELKQTARRYDATLFMTLLAIYNILLYKYTGQEDIVVGSAVAGRRHPDTAHIVGVFLNTLAMRSRPSGHLTFEEFLASVREYCLDAFENQDYQFEELVEKLGVKRDLSRNPLFDTMFNLHNMETSEIQLEDLTLTRYPLDHSGVKFDFKLMAEEDHDRLLFDLEYVSLLFKPATMERFRDNFLRILETVVRQPSVPINQIDFLAPEGKQKMMDDFNDDMDVDF